MAHPAGSKIQLVVMLLGLGAMFVFVGILLLFGTGAALVTMGGLVLASGVAAYRTLEDE
jgi:hypothetical protein